MAEVHVKRGKVAKSQQMLSAVLVLLILILAFGIWYGNKKLNAKAEVVASTKAQADASADQYQSLLQTQAEVKKLGDLPQLVDQALPSSDNQSLDVAELTKFASDNGINLTSIVFNDPKTAPKPTNLPGGVSSVSLSVQATDMSYSQLLGFLSEMEQNRHLMQPVNISILPSPDGKNISQLDLDLNLYYMK